MGGAGSMADDAGAAGGHWFPSTVPPTLLGIPGPWAEPVARTAGPRRGWGWRSPSAVPWHWLSGSDFSTSWQRARLWDSRQGLWGGIGPELWDPSVAEQPGRRGGWGGPGGAGGLAGRVAVGIWADR